MVAVLEFFNDRCRTDAHIRTDEPNCSDHHSTEDHALSISKNVALLYAQPLTCGRLFL